MTSILIDRPCSATLPAFRGLGPMVAIVFLGFLSVAVPLPVLSLYLHGGLHFSTAVVGWVIGIQSIATVLTRHRAGTLCDLRGPRRGVLLGLPVAACAGLLYLLSTASLGHASALAVLVAGRLVLGLGESLFVTGTMAWGIGRVGPARTGLVMSWQGIAMYAALGLGAPIGLAVQHATGFRGVCAVAIAAPAIAFAIAFGVRPVPGSGGGARVPFHHVLRLIWRPGVVQALASAPFAAMAAFLPLDYAQRGWSGAGLAIAAFAAGFIAVRLLFGRLPDRLGGITVAAGSLAIECVGQVLVWLAANALLAGAGALLTGIGFSLTFPAMGVEATRRVPPEQRGRAVGNFIAFFDVAIGLTGPVAGLLAAWFGTSVAFLAGAVATLLGLALLPSVARTRHR